MKDKRNKVPEQAKKVFKGVIFDVYQWDQEMFDGSVEVFEKLKRPDTVNVIPVTEDGKILVLEQEQPGKPPFLSVAGGRMEEGESEEAAARRELLEETGYTCEELILWKQSEPMGKIDWVVYDFIAKGCKKTHEPHLDAGEKINVKVVSFDDFVKIASSEEFSEPEITLMMLRALLDEEKMKEVKKLILG